jgi:predicted phage tail protein
MYRNVTLLGELAQFGDNWTVEASSIGDIVRLISCQEPEFRPFIIKCLEDGLDISIATGAELVSEPEELLLGNYGAEDVVMSLIPSGAGKGWAKVLGGVALIAIGFIVAPVAIGAAAGTAVAGATTATVYTSSAFWSSTFIAMGAGLALQGITQLLTKAPKTSDQEKGPGIFDGPDSQLKQGTPVPLLYGELLVSGVPFHVDFKQGSAGEWTFGTSPVTFASQGAGNITPNPYTQFLTPEYFNSIFSSQIDFSGISR